MGLGLRQLSEAEKIRFGRELALININIEDLKKEKAEYMADVNADLKDLEKKAHKLANILESGRIEDDDQVDLFNNDEAYEIVVDTEKLLEAAEQNEGPDEKNVNDSFELLEAMEQDGLIEEFKGSPDADLFNILTEHDQETKDDQDQGTSTDEIKED